MDLSKQIKEIAIRIKKSGLEKISLAITLLETRNNINWKETKYGTWRGFCDAEVAMSFSNIYVCLKTVEMAYNNLFGNADMNAIVAAIGWERFRLGLTKIASDEIIDVATFIERYKDLNLNERIVYGENESNLINFSFGIPQEMADRLTSALEAHGMRTTNKSRSNMSAAMVKLLNEVLPE